MSIMFLQTSDPFVYIDMLRATQQTNIPFCKRNGLLYESYEGIKRGSSPWMATYNRIFMLNEILDRGFSGWVMLLDADAFVSDPLYSIHSYLAENKEFCLIGATGGSSAPWNINAGVLFINLGDGDGIYFVREWMRQFAANVPDHYLNSPNSKWDEYPNDQELMYRCIKSSSSLMSKTKREEGSIFNYRDGAFIKQALRAGFPDIKSRINWIENEVAITLGTSRLNEGYVDLTGLANKYGSDKGDIVGNAHYYTSFYQFMFESFRLQSFEFAEIGLLRGGPEVGGSLDRMAQDAPSVRMWLEYFPNAICHGIDISDFSSINLDRFRFHRADMGSSADLARLREHLPTLKFVMDDASHASFHQQMSFATLFQLIEPGGYYVIEDMDWQPATYEPVLPPCALTRDVFINFTTSKRLDIRFLSQPERKVLASQIGAVHILRRRGDGIAKMVAIQHK